MVRFHAPTLLRNAAAKLLFVCATSFATAGVLQIDWKTPGDKMIVKDEETGLEFLRLSASFGLSFDTAKARTVSGGQFAGFRHATFDEVNTLLSHVPLPQAPDTRNGWVQHTITLEELNTFRTLFGMYDNVYMGKVSPQGYGFVADEWEYGRKATVIYSHDTYYNMAPRVTSTTYPSSWSWEGAGNWLVRQGTVGPDLKQLVDALQVELKAADATIASLNSQIATLTAQLTAANSLNATLTTTNQSLSQQLQAANDQIVALEKQLSAAAAKAAADAASISKLETSVADLKGQLAAANASIATLSSQLSAATTLNSQLQATIDAQKATIAALSTQLGASFGDPAFKIPGNTVEQQMANLSAAISDLNNGQKQAIYKNLTGKK